MNTSQSLLRRIYEGKGTSGIMMLLGLLLFIFLLGLSSAQSGENVRSKSFGESPQSDCSLRVADLHQKIDDYLKVAKFGNRVPQDYLEKYRALVGFVSAHEGRTCATEVATEYAIVMFDRITPFHSAEINGLKTRKTELVALLREMQRMNLLVPLFPSIRKSIVENGGSEQWLRLLGGYDCASEDGSLHEDGSPRRFSAIYFDPNLPPLDLGSVIAHELDHLLRDKLTYGEHWEKSQSGSSVDEMVVLDEVMANVMGALTQFRFFMDHNRNRSDQRLHRIRFDERGKLASDYEAEEAFPGSHPSPFEALTAHYARFNVPEQQDLDLFNRRGLVYRIWWKHYRKMVKGRGQGIPLFGGFEELYEAFQNPKALPNLEKFIQLISKVYFPQKEIRIPEVAAKIQEWISEKNPYANIAPMKAAMSHRFADSDDSFRSLHQMLDQPSRGCLAKGGVVLPAEGVRPLVEGVRPAAEGVRPSTKIRPCFRPEKGV